MTRVIHKVYFGGEKMYESKSAGDAMIHALDILDKEPSGDYTLLQIHIHRKFLFWESKDYEIIQYSKLLNNFFNLKDKEAINKIKKLKNNEN